MKRAPHKSDGQVTMKEHGDGWIVTVHKEALPPHYSELHETLDEALADFNRLAVITMTLPEASEWYEVPAPTLYSAVQEGRLSARKAGGTWLIGRADLEKFTARYKPRGS